MGVRSRIRAHGTGFALEGWLATATDAAPCACQRKHARSVHPLLCAVVLAGLGLSAYGVHQLGVGRALSRWTRLTAPASSLQHASPWRVHGSRPTGGLAPMASISLPSAR